MTNATRTNRWEALRRGEVGLALAVVVVVGLTAALDAQHSYLVNPGDCAIQILRQAVMLGIIAIGSAVVIIAGGIDLSIGSMMAFSGTICASLLVLLDPEGVRQTTPGLAWGTIATAIAGTLGVALVVGALHAWLITKVGLPPFIATLSTLVGLRSLARIIVDHVHEAAYGTGNKQIFLSNERFHDLGASVGVRSVVFMALALLVWTMLSRTVVGRHLYALGGNEAAARLSGIRTHRLKWFAYSISALCSAIAGMLNVADVSAADPQTLGVGYELNAIAADVVGGCSLQGGVGTIPGTVLGSLFLRVVIDSIAKAISTGAEDYEGLIVGVLVVLAVALNQFRSRTR